MKSRVLFVYTRTASGRMVLSSRLVLARLGAYEPGNGALVRRLKDTLLVFARS